MTDVFTRAFGVVIGAEGGLSMAPIDPGNWTGGAQGKGELLGTKYGLSSAVWYGKTSQWPPTLDDAHTIYQRDYWDKISANDLPPPVALVTFDAAVNSGPAQAARWLQAAAGVAQDGQIGPATLAAVKASKVMDLIGESIARRLVFMASLNTWQTFGLGWSRRLAHLAVAAVAFDVGPIVTVQTIKPAPIVASLEDVKAAVREAMATEKAA